MGVILDHIGEAAMFEQLAEESAELSHAALKAARAIRRENPTPVTVEEAIANVREEYTDVFQCASHELGIHADWKQVNRKEDRFVERWEESHG